MAQRMESTNPELKQRAKPGTKRSSLNQDLKFHTNKRRALDYLLTNNEKRSTNSNC